MNGAIRRTCSCRILVIWFLVARGFVQMIAQNRWNARQPVLSTPARVVTKRTSVSSSAHSTGPDTPPMSSTSTSYYATFESPDGERRELPVPGKEYGLLVEGDQGTLSTQGTWYKGFVRERF